MIERQTSGRKKNKKSKWIKYLAEGSDNFYDSLEMKTTKPFLLLL